MITVTKQFTFAYAHFLPGHEGECANLHGHTGILEIEVGRNERAFCNHRAACGNIDAHMVVDFGKLKAIVHEYVISKLDHKLLNDVLPDNMPPTAENIVLWVKQQIEDLPASEIGFLTRIRCYETPTSWAEWRKV